MPFKVLCIIFFGQNEITVNASWSGRRGQSGSVIASKSNRSLWTCSNVSQVLAQLAIEKMAVRSNL